MAEEAYFGDRPDENEAGGKYANLRAFIKKGDFERAMGTLYNMLGGGGQVSELAKRAAFDGVTVYGHKRGEDMLVEAVAFNPTQIKSSIGNNGDFDPSNPDIRYNIIGDSGRTYNQNQHAFFKNVGRDVDRQSIIEKTLDYLKSDFWKKMAIGVVDQFRGLRDLNDGGQAYLLALLSKGTAGAFDTLLHHGKLSLKDGVYDGDTSGGFVERLGVPLNGELDDFLWWVAANRAEKLTADGKENLFSPTDIQAGKSLAAGLTTFDYTIQTGQSKGTTTRNRQVIYQDALRVFNEFQKNVLDLSEHPA